MKQMNHAEYQKTLKKKEISTLRYIIQDCKDALIAHPHNPNAGYYQDEINYCVMEIVSRRSALKAKLNRRRGGTK